MEMYFFTMETSCWRNISHLHVITQFVGFRVETEMILIDAVQLSNSSYLSIYSRVQNNKKESDSQWNLVIK